ncbi:hypothetical protein PROFUN_12527 [Planoprotostelium fungivorum]|uniref:Uncharacterized protein n=1 Tax=Planoprotostelium fungivorum TaxID=1890364 RepID=A0A2P6MS41_9EUKA|nr:hypothetical protein PROFUN_12527 [Planoprotostelium fungivorum]
MIRSVSSVTPAILEESMGADDSPDSTMDHFIFSDVSAVSEADVSEVEMDSEDEALRKRGWIKKKCHIEDVPNWDASWVVVRSEDLGREMTESEITDLMYQADDRALFRRVFREFEHLYSESQREEIRQQFLRNGDSWTWILKKSYRMLYCAEIIVAPTICDKRHSYWEAIQSEDKPTPTYILFTNVPSLILEEIPDKFTWSAQKPRLDTFQLVWGWVCEKGTGFTHIFYDREKILQKNADKLVVMLFYRKETTGFSHYCQRYSCAPTLRNRLELFFRLPFPLMNHPIEVLISIEDIIVSSISSLRQIIIFKFSALCFCADHILPIEVEHCNEKNAVLLVFRKPNGNMVTIKSRKEKEETVVATANGHNRRMQKLSCHIRLL